MNRKHVVTAVATALAFAASIAHADTLIVDRGTERTTIDGDIVAQLGAPGSQGLRIFFSGAHQRTTRVPPQVSSVRWKDGEWSWVNMDINPQEPDRIDPKSDAMRGSIGQSGDRCRLISYQFVNGYEAEIHLICRN